jgi:beta-lactam-binding protein with PASTA domain
VPSYVGGTEAAAIAGLGSISNVSYGTSSYVCDASAAGTVLSQSATGVVACGAVIDLTVSSGSPSVPSYVGGTEAAAIAGLGSISNVSYGTSSYVCDASAAGTVLSQSATGIVACGAVIDLTVSSGPPSAPDVTGMDEASAIAAINGTANISYGSSTSVCDASAAGTVLSQSATGTVACGAVIDLTVSSGQPSVPDLTGGDEATAIATLGGIADISYGTSTGQCDASPAGTVLAQSATGTVPCGTVINLTVSTGEPSAPDVTGLDEATAVATLNGTADISVGTVTYVCDAAPIGICLSQSATGTVPCGTSIDIVVSSGPADAPDVTGMDEATAIATLNGTANISYGSSSNQYDDVVPLGDVISQSATGTVGCGAVIDLVISDGPADRLISGTLTEPDDTTAIEGILIELSDGSASDVTDPNGYYELVVDYGWSGIVEPNAVGFVFDPNETLRTLTSVASDTVLDLTGSLEALVISGTILDDGAVPLSGVTVTPDNGGGYYTNKYDGGGVGVTDAAGYYEVLVDYDWSGSVTPTDNAYTFAPLSSSYSNVAGPVAAQDYTGTMLTFSITGTIENVLGAPVEGVTVTADNGGGTDTSDPTGYYEVWVSYDWSGNVTLSMADYTFTPPSTAYANVTINQAQDFTAQLDADIDGDGFVGLPDLIILCENWLMVGDLSLGDLDDSGFIDMGDVAELGGYWQQ